LTSRDPFGHAGEAEGEAGAGEGEAFEEGSFVHGDRGLSWLWEVTLILGNLLSMSAAHSLSNLQQELLKLYSSGISEADLLHIKCYLAKYFAFKAIGEADQIWDEKGYTNDTMNQWLDSEGQRG
jgi:hypothetical protein